MTAEELQQLIRRRPFEPMRIHLTDGASYDIWHPDNILVLRHRIDIGRAPDPKTGVLEAVDSISLLHVVRIETITPASPPTNSNSLSA